jgi:hypothetical protein
LAAYPTDAIVRLALAPGYPQATMVGPIACSPDDADLTDYARHVDGDRPGEGPSNSEQSVERIVWIAEGTQIGYLPDIARDALGPWAR